MDTIVNPNRWIFRIIMLFLGVVGFVLGWILCQRELRKRKAKV